MKLTGWISAKTPPVREGWYQCFGCFAESPPEERSIVWRYWTGKRWKWLSTLRNEIADAAVSPGDDKWRGVAGYDAKGAA